MLFYQEPRLTGQTELESSVIASHDREVLSVDAGAIGEVILLPGWTMERANRRLPLREYRVGTHGRGIGVVKGGRRRKLDDIEIFIVQNQIRLSDFDRSDREGRLPTTSEPTATTRTNLSAVDECGSIGVGEVNQPNSLRAIHDDSDLATVSGHVDP